MVETLEKFDKTRDNISRRRPLRRRFEENNLAEAPREEQPATAERRIYKSTDPHSESFEEVPWFIKFITYLGYFQLVIFGFIGKKFFWPEVAKEKNRDGYQLLYNPKDLFFVRNLYRRVSLAFNNPIASAPAVQFTVMERKTNDYGWSYELTGRKIDSLNLGSYNYLGFGENTGPCASDCEKTIKEFGLTYCSSRRELGNNSLHIELEELTARFLGVEDAIVFGMGFATNALNIPALLTTGCLAISDRKNHASINLGIRLSGASIKMFKHNDMQSLEEKLADAVLDGQPITGKPWKKIIIFVEGIFSMEGSIVKLPEVIALKNKYKAYLFLDEAHSIGAMGPNGAGICDYFGIDSSEVDILMGTFTKSFGSSGGYIAGKRSLINYLRVNSHAHCYASSMSPPVAQQAITSMKIIMGLDGTNEGKSRINQLARNTRYFRKRLEQIGVIIYGHKDSPVVPMILCVSSKLSSTVDELRKRGVSTVFAGFPATPITKSRIRFCLSAAHTKEQLDLAVKAVDEVAEKFRLKYSRKPRDQTPIEY